MLCKWKWKWKMLVKCMWRQKKFKWSRQKKNQGVIKLKAVNQIWFKFLHLKLSEPIFPNVVSSLKQIF